MAVFFFFFLAFLAAFFAAFLAAFLASAFSFLASAFSLAPAQRFKKAGPLVLGQGVEDGGVGRPGAGQGGLVGRPALIGQVNGIGARIPGDALAAQLLARHHPRDEFSESGAVNTSRADELGLGQAFLGRRCRQHGKLALGQLDAFRHRLGEMLGGKLLGAVEQMTRRSGEIESVCLAHEHSSVVCRARHSSGAASQFNDIDPGTDGLAIQSESPVSSGR